MCDSSRSARFGTAFRNVGRSGDYGGSWFLQRIAGPGIARELYFTAEMIDAARAKEIGIANHVFTSATFLEDALAFCARIAAGPAGAYARMKENLNAAQRWALPDLMDFEARHQRTAAMTHDAQEAVRAFQEKREPRFRS